MKKPELYKKFLWVIIFSTLLISCGGDDEPMPDPHVPRTADDVREDFQNLTINVGINDLTLESVVEGVFWKFRLIVPESASTSNKIPLILRLHGAAKSGASDAHKSTDCLVVPGFEEMDAYILSPNSNGFYWYDEPNLVQVLALLDLTKANLHVDVNKVVAMGYSDGGNGSWFFGKYYSSLFSAAIPMATSFDSENSAGDIEPTNTPLYVVHGSDDEHFPLEITEGYVEESIEAGSDIQFVVADGLGHIEPCEYVPYLKDAVDWLKNEVWD